PPGSNPGRSRAYNRGLVLGHLRTAGLGGRAEIARASGLTTQTVSNIIADLKAEGLLREAGRRATGRGLPAVQYQIEPSGGFALGVEIRTDAIHMALLDLAGAARWSDRMALDHADPDTVATALNALRTTCVATTGIAETRLLGAGVVLPGPFGRTGLSDPATELPGWIGIDARATLEAALSLPVVIENDANAAAVAERLSGVARGLTHFAFVYFGIGLGLGLVSDGTLVRGACGNAGELGHLRIDGMRLEDIASRLALSQRVAQAGLAAVTIEDLDQPNATTLVKAWAQEAGPALGNAITILENLFDPQTIILGGALPDKVLDHLIAHIPLSDTSLACRADRDQPRLLRGSAGNLTATLGAGALMIDRLFTASLSST
ncbi:ROK family transcriptional regulator, partial [uncultured Aliiroseovarius sp.]